jgi:hypothetical protein
LTIFSEKNRKNRQDACSKRQKKQVRPVLKDKKTGIDACSIVQNYYKLYRQGKNRSMAKSIIYNEEARRALKKGLTY